MKDAKLIGTPSRRHFVIAAGYGGAALATMSLIPRQLLAQEKTLEEAIHELVGDASPSDGRITVDLPQIAENGNTVPLGISVESPMTEADHVKSIHVFATGNPRPDVASFHFTPRCGEANCSTRMRLAKTQDVMAIAEMSNGELYLAKAEVKVTIGGCGG